MKKKYFNIYFPLIDCDMLKHVVINVVISVIIDVSIATIEGSPTSLTTYLVVAMEHIAKNSNCSSVEGFVA